MAKKQKAKNLAAAAMYPKPENIVAVEPIINIYARITPKMKKNIDEIKNIYDMLTDSEVVRLAISNLYRDASSMARDTSKKNLSPFPVGRPKGLNKEGKKLERCREIAKALNGEIVMRGESETVVYTIYEKTNPVLVQKFEQEIPLAMMDEKHIRDQYKPSREECEETLKIMASKK